MGRRDSSSKVKSSKRKRDKISSKKKSRTKDRKKRRIADSVTANSVDDLLNSGPSPFPTLKSDHTKRINKKNKVHRHTSLSSYSDYESLSSDSDSDNAYKSRKARRGSKDKKRRKRLDRDGIVKPIKKTSKKKLSKYSSSSDSESHSIGQSSGSSADGLRQRSKVIPKRDRERRGSQKGKKIHKERTPSCSSFDTDIEPSLSISNSDKTLFPTNNSRRLRSVIVVVDHSRDEVDNGWEIAPHEQEILHNQNDCPCPKSNENLAVEDVGKSGVDIGDLDNHELERAQTDDSGGVILESILRQKALERLRKFQQRGPRNTTVKKNNESDDVGTVDTDQNKLIKEGSSNAQEINKVSALSSEPEFSLTQSANKKVPDSAHFDKDPGMAKQSSEEGKIVDTCSSSTMEPSSSIGPLERGNEATDASQFQQKTMSVMRGGEQVQVSYKVYIPKKAPALARRQLRR